MMKTLSGFGILMLAVTVSAHLQSRQPAYQRIRKDDADYVTQAEFKNATDTFEKQMNDVIASIEKGKRDFNKSSTNFQKQIDDVKASLNKTQEDLKKSYNVVEGQLNKVATDLGTTQNDMKSLQTTIDTDHCSDSPCQNYGTCENRLNDYNCVCRATFGGKNCEHAIGMQNSKILEVDNGGSEGIWSLWRMCPQGSYARTFKIKLEDPGGDDTSMNNVEIVCKHVVTSADTYITTGMELFGTWRAWQDCPKGEFLVGFSLKVEEDQGTHGDDSSVNGMRSTCTNGSTHTGTTGQWGSFGSTAMCPEGHSICGLQVKQEPNQGGGDDSALNDIRFMCCASFS